MSNLNLKKILIYFSCLVMGIIPMACKKLVTVDEPINTITTTEVFSTDATATSAMAGIYSKMVNGPNAGTTSSFMTFSAGLTTFIAGMSSDDLYLYTGSLNGDPAYFYNTNHLTAMNAGASSGIWTSAYGTIYGANSVIEGIRASTSAALHDNLRNELTAEAKFVRAFSYLYLTNFFGDVPMVLTIDFNKTATLPRMPQQQVYQQIIKDLTDAQTLLPADYAASMGERILPTKWAADLLLARVALYTNNYADAAAKATMVINNGFLFSLEPNLNSVFLTTSREAIWQLKQTTTDNTILKNATPEGALFLPLSLATGSAPYCLTSQLLSAFEKGDQRRIAWVDSTDNSYNLPASQGVTYYPYKYKIGQGNSVAGQPPLEYYMVLRLAEAYLIRAEAAVKGAPGGIPAGMADLNVIRQRAGLSPLSTNLSSQQAVLAVAKERQTELFVEWGHRWFDLKKTGEAHNTLSVIPLKQPWAGDYQLLYPIPLQEITYDHFLTQTPGY
jgi:hypothetical protein